MLSFFSSFLCSFLNVRFCFDDVGKFDFFFVMAFFTSQKCFFNLNKSRIITEEIIFLLHFYQESPTHYLIFSFHCFCETLFELG